MNRDTTTSPTADWGQLLWDPLRLSAMANEYAVDAWQRSILYADVRRQRGNQYQEHLQEQTPNVLDFASRSSCPGWTFRSQSTMASCASCRQPTRRAIPQATVRGGRSTRGPRPRHRRLQTR